MEDGIPPPHDVDDEIVDAAEDQVDGDRHADGDDPHPAPYLRVQFSYAFGKRLFPHSQWERIWEMWKRFYPLEGLDAESIHIIQEIEREIEPFIDLVINHSTKEMKGKKLWELFPLAERKPENLKQLFVLWKSKKTSLDRMRPTLVFALLGQAKFDLAIDAAEESKVLTQQLRQWAFFRNYKFKQNKK